MTEWRPTDTRWKLYLAVTVAVLMLAAGYLWLRSHVATYDQQWSDCMREKEAQIAPHRFPDPEYDQAMRECEKRAGVPVLNRHSNSWEWP
jgi:hypothetical protein